MSQYQKPHLFKWIIWYWTAGWSEKKTYPFYGAKSVNTFSVEKALNMTFYVSAVFLHFCNVVLRTFV